MPNTEQLGVVTGQVRVSFLPWSAGVLLSCTRQHGTEVVRIPKCHGRCLRKPLGVINDTHCVSVREVVEPEVNPG